MSIGYALVTIADVAVIAQRQRNQPAGLPGRCQANVRPSLGAPPPGFWRCPSRWRWRSASSACRCAGLGRALGLPGAGYLARRRLVPRAFKANSSAARTEWWWSFAHARWSSGPRPRPGPGAGIVLLVAFRSLDPDVREHVTSAVYVAVTPTWRDLPSVYHEPQDGQALVANCGATSCNEGAPGVLALRQRHRRGLKCTISSLAPASRYCATRPLSCDTLATTKRPALLHRRHIGSMLPAALRCATHVAGSRPASAQCWSGCGLLCQHLRAPGTFRRRRSARPERSVTFRRRRRS